MKVELLAITQAPEQLIERAARTCCQSEGSIAPGSAAQFIRRLIERGHESVLEHAYATFNISGISRACSHQLVRHRLCSFSQKSQRCVSEEDFEYVIPPSIPDECQSEFEQDMAIIRDMYAKYRRNGLKNEDARFVLPNACTTGIVLSANFREFRHIFGVRALDPRSQWEVRQVTLCMLRGLHKYAPNVFGDLMKAARKIHSDFVQPCKARFVDTVDIPDDQTVFDILDVIIDQALKGGNTAQQDLEEIFEDDWKTVKERVQVEGSGWIVWWTDGARKLMRKITSGEWGMDEEDA